MNQARRVKLNQLSAKLQPIIVELESIKDEEVEANEAKPEHMQDSSAADALDQAYTDLDSCMGSIDEAANA